jgi:hypothetical protein
MEQENNFEQWYNKVIELFEKSILSSLCEISKQDVELYWKNNQHITPEQYITDVENDWKEVSGLY